MRNFLHNFLKGLSTGTGIIAAVGVAAVVLAAGGGVLFASQSDMLGGSSYDKCFVLAYSGWDPNVKVDTDESGAQRAAANAQLDKLFVNAAYEHAVSRYYQWDHDKYVVQEAARRGRKIVLIGHSAGGAAALKLASWLGEPGDGEPSTNVALLVEMDTYRDQLFPFGPLETAGQTLAPSNVEFGLNYYQRGLAGSQPERPGIVNVPLDPRLFEHQAVPDYVAIEGVVNALITQLCKTGTLKAASDSLPNHSVAQQAEPGTETPIFRIEDGAKRPVSLEVAQACGWLAELMRVPKTTLDAIPTGTAIQSCDAPPPADGSVVQQQESGPQTPIYRIEGGKKRLATLEVVQSCGWLNQVTKVPKAVLDAMPTGPEVPPCGQPTFCITGFVRGLNSEVKIGAIISVEGGGNGPTDGNGSYHICGLVPGSYKITASLDGSSVAPPFLRIVLGPDATGQNFTAVPGGGACIKGYVTGSAGPSSPVPGASLTLNDGRVAATGSDGGYSFCGLPPGSYKVTPASSNYSFGPSSKDIGLGSTNAEGVNFTASAIGKTFCVSGQITESAGPTKPIANIPIRIDGAVQATTGGDGRYTKCGLPEGGHTIVPEHSDWAFGPVSRTVSGPPDQAAGFTGIPVKHFCIAGFATGPQGPSNPTSGATIEISGPDSARVTTAADGSFKACRLREGNYSLTSSKPKMTCNPNPRSVFLSGADSPSEGFTCTPIEITGDCPSPRSPLFPADGAYIPAGQSVVLEWIGIPGCRYGVTLLEGCSNVHVPVLDVPTWNLTGLSAGSRCGWFVQGVDSNGAFDSPVAQWWVNWGDPPQRPVINSVGCAPTSVQTGATVSCTPAVNGTVVNWAWTVDGAQEGTGQTFTRSWTAAGARTIQLSVSNIAGSDTKSITIQVTQAPTPPPSVSPSPPVSASPLVSPSPSVSPSPPTLTGPTIVSVGCTGANQSGLDHIWLANWGQLFTCTPNVSGLVTSWLWTAPGGNPASGSSGTFATSWGITGSQAISLHVCNSGGCDDMSQSVRLPNCDISPYQGGPHIAAIAPAPCSVVPAGQPITIRWSVDFAGQAPPSTMFMALQMSECVPAGEGYGTGSNMVGENSATISALPAGVRCRWHIRATQNGTSEAGPASNDFYFYVR
jgi:PKD domain